jgi:RNA polymerase sigma factor (sigma-70 family)
MNEPLDKLLARLCSGDSAAAEQVFLAFEPYLRKVVRRHLPAPLRAKFDPADIIQSVWADVLHGFRKAGWRFIDADHLRGFLFIATRNRLIDRIRQHQKALDREEPLGEGDQRHEFASAQPRPSEVVQAGDLWEQILAHCPPEHRPIPELRRQGYSLAEIAERTGLHPDSVRRILRTLARKLAFEQAGVRGQRSGQPREGAGGGPDAAGVPLTSGL